MGNTLKVIINLLFFIYVLGGNERSKRVRRIVGGLPADIAASEDPIVFTNHAGKFARVHGTFEASYYHFRGIRYALAPTGRDRFQRPRKYFLEGEVNATAYGSPCIQPVPGVDLVFGSEDCLFLNVFTPSMPDGTNGLPVIVWIHGGGFRYGSASQYGAKYLMKKNVILVTIQYRLGTFGFLTSGNSIFPGNAALFDMALAIEWVKNHIGFFGGNPYRINVMGQGTGGSSASLVTLSDIMKGQIGGIIAMSGTALSHWAIDNTPSKTAEELANYHGCIAQSTVLVVKCLQMISAKSIVMGDSYMESTRLEKGGFTSGLCGLLSSSPVTEGVNDGRSLPGAVQRKPLDDMYFKRIPKIPFLTGVTQDETKRAVQGPYKKEITGKLRTVSHFLDNLLIRNLQSLTGLGKDVNNSEASAFWKTLDPLEFQSYITVARNNFDEALEKISEVTSDVLFNLPAFLTAELWSKNYPQTYLYRFEHFGQARKGDQFLRGIPLIGNHTSKALNGSVCHGDELAYLFEAQNLDGTELADPDFYTAEDEEVREIFTELIADFARHGKIIIKNEEVKPFSSAENNFIRIKPKPKIGINFRFCEMALWAGLVERLQDAACKFFQVPSIMASAFFDTVNVAVPKPLSDVELFPKTLLKPSPQIEDIPLPLNIFG